jgi:hypothetical protein
MDNLTDKQLIQKIIRLAENRGLDPHRRYSGRCMFGATCIGFEGDNAECAALAAFIKRKTGRSFSYDNMGLNMIYYFPGIQDDGDDLEDDPNADDWVTELDESEDEEWNDDEQDDEDEWEDDDEDEWEDDDEQDDE